MAGKRAITKQSLPEVIANDLRERILSGDLSEGETIRQEALAEEYDVSRMPIREALKRLNAEGLVQWANNRGGSVTKHSLSEIGEIFDLRILIEVDLFRRAIPNMTSADFARCDEILTQMEASYDENDVGKWGILNYKYHSALYAASQRKLTNELLDRINLQSDRYVRMHLSVMKQREPAKKDHRDLLQLAQEGKTDEACDVLVRHIRRTKEQLLDMIASKRAAEEA
ncbi:MULTISPECIES: GntR family transcriptional regulator [unclassified Ruegeria]|uniref:GntR family transcriptional regulator n=1 Tax=unclassified Ruegeria TaxID=2625375 RepID=UPI0014895238|nr:MULTISPECIES: GntR family transcriptional regulator [unclassified Ruegeria]NOD34556.1 FCD domain-containing protein [Ruegeria sp. HKCCD7296]NOD47669.1 FCD domain-containing protein [Ruegeria sp. HKCCD5849]NOD52668.1 FCD domain-containing protein [Ruegeria sp. HKCCD5851]NOD66087.1 FCD domain-containing protein [Ruegeria sp. HKCCD7303]NOE35740.1 FCD domain-containing protein [Ruegeria sp. HKCCD7318]